jgi:two-component system response regulator NreC
MIRVLIVDNQPTFRRHLRALLECAGLEVVAEAGDIATAEVLAQSLQPDLAIVDVLLPDVSGIEGTPRLKWLAPNMRVIVVSAYNERLLQASAQTAGAESFIPKDELDLATALSWNKEEGDSK